MKALILEGNDGNTSFIILGSSKKAMGILNKICYSCNRFVCESKERLNKIIKKSSSEESFSFGFVGAGIYDHNGVHYEKLEQPEGNYSIGDYSEVTSNPDAIKVARVKLDFLFLS